MEIEEKFVWLLWHGNNSEISPHLFAVYSTYEAALKDLNLNKRDLSNPHIEQEKLY